MDISGKKEKGTRGSAGAIQSLASFLDKALGISCGGNEITLTPATDLWKKQRIEGTYIEVEDRGVYLAVEATRGAVADAEELFGAPLYHDKCEMYVYFEVP